MKPQFFTREVAVFGQQREGFRSSFDRAWLDASRPLSDAPFGDEAQQNLYGIEIDVGQTVSAGHAKLQRVFETQLTRQRPLYAGSLLHHSTDEIVGQQVFPDLLDRHGGALAAEYLHAHRGLQVAKVQLDISALLIEPLEFARGCQLGAQQRRH